MTPEEVQAFVHRYIEYQQARDAEALARLYAVDATIESPSVGTHRGRDAIRQGYRQWFTSFPDLKFDDHILHERRIYDFTGLLVKLGVLKVKPT